MEKILIVENNYNDYKKVLNALKNKNCTLIPNFKNYNEIQIAVNNDDIIEYVESKLNKHYQSLRAIICNFNLSNKYNGIDIVNFIRDYYDENKIDGICKNIPIILYSYISDMPLIEQGLEVGANYFISKTNPESLTNLVDDVLKNCSI